MNSGRIIFAIGLFVVPLLLLPLGHGLRRRSPRVRSAFWGAVTGYGAGVLVMSVITMIPPIHWDGTLWRTMLVHWSMLLGALLGFAAGAIFAPGAHDGDTSSAASEQHTNILI